jgi:hypothetical protein
MDTIPQKPGRHSFEHFDAMRWRFDHYAFWSARAKINARIKRGRHAMSEADPT